jgi:hypothetical protein
MKRTKWNRNEKKKKKHLKVYCLVCISNGRENNRITRGNASFHPNILNFILSKRNIEKVDFIIFVKFFEYFCYAKMMIYLGIKHIVQEI